MKKDNFFDLLYTNFEYKSPEKNNFLAEKYRFISFCLYYFKIIKLVFINRLISHIRPYNIDLWSKASLNAIKIAESVGGKIHISGLKPLAGYKGQGPVVFIANHMSLLDTFILPCITLMHSNVTFVVKEELLKYPIFGPFLQNINPISVTRRSPKQDLKTVLQQGQDRILKGYSVVIFPQSTRTNIFDVKSFNSLGIKLAKTAKVPVVPVALKTDFHGNGKIIKEMGQINPDLPLHVKFGSLIDVSGKGNKAHQKVVEFIAENMLKWGGKVKNK